MRPSRSEKAFLYVLSLLEEESKSTFTHSAFRVKSPIKTQCRLSPQCLNPVNQKTTINKDSWMVPIYEGSDSETDFTIPIYHMHSLNDYLSLWTGDAEDFIFKTQERMQFWPNLEYLLFEINIVNEENKVARHKLIQSFV